MNAEVNELSVVYYKKKRKQNKDGSPYEPATNGLYCLLDKTDDKTSRFVEIKQWQ